ncbi:hypothetical protein SARC_11872 [Sphaeroforma arctica JP610]|uniref:Dolichol-phosphate mannosyltransferase subunit 1 n=1 Tax=Sphaeroforma arctica JP610 TaxID=667725 RepID=A0A0L0FGN5_9EUKA|nr:hypothetical protein SARC_11872 [Sphaeroforma arctica JP610]KNC75606.1 hypothetical protein SARC_11872 [Sphaeroforma arctica JP610]|eukprot:XP_014149508.1 hypothetical protein SARC_11872 [Sphaeroforma arctica JP610]
MSTITSTTTQRSIGPHNTTLKLIMEELQSYLSGPSTVALALLAVVTVGWILLAGFSPQEPNYTPPFAIQSSEHKASVIVPAYQEQPNIRPLCERVFKATRADDLAIELIIVDDNSNDGSEEVVKELQAEGYDIKIEVRTKVRGLSTAVMHGFDKAKNEVMMVMDADLQHPPEIVPKLLRPLLSNKAHFAIGTRYAVGGGTENWAFHRRLISWTATALAWPIAPVSDPMTGLFAIRKSLYATGRDLDPRGFKIGLELMVKCAPHHTAEVPYLFGGRLLGESKLETKAQVDFIVHMMMLYWYKLPTLITSPKVVFFVAALAMVTMQLVSTVWDTKKHV